MAKTARSAHAIGVGERLFVQLERGDQVARAAQDAESWGFPRPVSEQELEGADWWRMLPGVVFWFEHYGISPTHFVHLAVDPAARGRWGARRWIRWVYRYAASQGASAPGFVRCQGSEQSERYLRRLDWQETHYGLSMPLGVA